MASKVQISTTVDQELLDWIDRMVERKVFANRSHGIEVCITRTKEKEKELFPLPPLPPRSPPSEPKVAATVPQPSASRPVAGPAKAPEPRPTAPAPKHRSILSLGRK